MKSRFRTNVVRQRRFSELLQQSLTRYENRAIETAQVIEELIAIAQKFREAALRQEALGLLPAELAFYDALAENPSAQALMGDRVLCAMAKELTEKLRSNITIDWARRETVRAGLRVMVRILLKRYKYPPDQQPDAIDLVLSQAETLGDDWVQAS